MSANPFVLLVGSLVPFIRALEAAIRSHSEGPPTSVPESSSTPTPSPAPIPTCVICRCSFLPLDNFTRAVTPSHPRHKTIINSLPSSSRTDDLAHLSQIALLSAEGVDGVYQLLLLDEQAGIFAINDPDHPDELDLM